jgi:hypothetical protein
LFTCEQFELPSAAVRNEDDGCFIDAVRQHGRAMGKILISTAVVSLALIIAFAVYVITL